MLGAGRGGVGGVDLTPIGAVDQSSRRAVLHRTMDADPSTVWRALSEAAGLSAWLGRPQGPPLGPGVVFELWHEEQVRSVHEVLEMVPPHLLTLAWDFPGEAASWVRFTVKDDARGAVVTVEHTGVDDPVAYAAGWHVHLDFLARYLGGRPRSFDGFWEDYEELVRRYGAAGLK